MLSEGARSPYAPLLAALGALFAGALVAVTLESMALGLRERLVRNRHRLHLADGAGGAALVACLALGVVWVVRRRSPCMRPAPPTCAATCSAR